VTASSSGGGVQISVMPGGSDIMSDAAGVLAFDVAGTTVTPVPQDPTPMTTEPPRPPPPPGVTGGGGGGAASGGCGCRLASGRPVGHVGMVGLLALMVLGMRRRRRAR